MHQTAWVRWMLLTALIGGLPLTLASAETFTWDGSVNRQWDAITTPAFPPDTNWNFPVLPGSEDTVRFDGAAPGPVFVGGELGPIKHVNRIELVSNFEDYELKRDPLFGGTLLIGAGGLVTDNVGWHTINADVIVAADSQWHIDSNRLKIAGGLNTGGHKIARTGTGRLIFDQTPESTSVDQLLLADGMTTIQGGHFEAGLLTFGNFFSNDDDVDLNGAELRIREGARVRLQQVGGAPLDTENTIRVFDPGTRLQANFGDQINDILDPYTLRLLIDDGATVEANMTEGAFELNQDDTLVVDQAQLRVGAIETASRIGSGALRLSDPADGRSALLVEGPRDSVIRADLTDEDKPGSLRKRGASTLVLEGKLALTGGVFLEAGTLEVRSPGGVTPGGAIEISEQASLRAAASITRAVRGPGKVEAVGDTLLGDFASEHGFEVGSLNVGGHDVVLLDKDRARLTHGVSTIAGGRLRTIAGLELLSPAALEGNGVIEGRLINQGRLEATNGQLVLKDSVRGNGAFLGTLVFDGLFEPGNSTSQVTMESPQFRRLVRLELGGTAPGAYDQLRMLGQARLDAPIDVLFIDGFQPSPGEQFTLLTTGEAGALIGALPQLNLPRLDQGLTWSTQYNEDRLRIQVIPEPGSVALLGAAVLTVLSGRPGRRSA